MLNNVSKFLLRTNYIVEAPFEFFWTLMSVLYDDVQMDWSINSQEYNYFEIYAFTIKISMIEYHPWINGQDYNLFSWAVYGEK